MPIFESEREFEDVLMENHSILTEEFGGSKFIRQFNLPGYGVIDILGIGFDLDNNDNEIIVITVFELKLKEIGHKAISQICKYKTGIQHCLKDEITYKKNKYKPKIKGVLIGSELENGSSCFIYENIDWLDAYTYNIHPINGLTFKSESEWMSTNEDNKKAYKCITEAITTNNASGEM